MDNGKEFQSESFKRFCMDNNITLEYRPVRTPEYGGFIESVWDTVNGAIRDVPIHGRVYPILKSREPISSPKIKGQVGFDSKKDAALTLDAFREWLFGFIVARYSVEARARQFQSPNQTWLDGLQGACHQPLGGALRIADEKVMVSLNYEAKRAFTARLSRHGFRYKNVSYSSDWLCEARKKGILRDKKQYSLRVSHWDVRHAYIVNPETHEVETLEAYKFDGDRRVHTFLLQGLGRVQGMRPFPVSLNELTGIQDSVCKHSPVSQCGEPDQNIMALMSENVQASAKRNKKQRRLLDKIARGSDGKEVLEQAELLAQKENKARVVHGGKNCAKQENNETSFNDVATVLPGTFSTSPQVPRDMRIPVNMHAESISTVEAFPTDWDSVPDSMKLGYVKEREE